MKNELIKDYLLEWIGKLIEPSVERDLHVSHIDSRATVIVGPRRAGKTYFLLQIARKLKREETLYLNFEDSRLRTIYFNEIRDLIRQYIELTGKNPKTILLDEIQNVNEWEIAVRELLDQNRYSIFITGSSSKLLSKEVATQLRGRSLTYLMLPFSFLEYLKVKQGSININVTMDMSAKIMNMLNEYLEWGGFPEIVIYNKEKERILKEYYDLILFKDIIERNSMKNISLARFILEQLLQNFSKEITVNSIIKHADGIKLSKDTTYDYVDKVLDSAGVFFLNKISQKPGVRESWPKKSYVCDTGLTKAVRFSSDIGKLMENCVFLEIVRQVNISPFLKIFYWKDTAGKEVDFVLKESTEIKALIQVTYASSEDEIDKREIESIILGANTLKCKKLIVITWNYRDSINIQGYRIKYIPLWEWLIAKDKY
ncbi:MAG: ATP-binding protein [Candidatus Thermoplasmatota archaeon]|nr:ATP-binding protein [Candidatus Thermoplasmatota archaeon]MCL5963882.1 ATP-binding protein [Candidatus Thermoplasmatota archaeon]